MGEIKSERLVRTFNSTDEASRVWARLNRSGFLAQSITLMSSEPIHVAVEEAGRVRPSRIGLFSVGGAVIGAMGALLLTILTSQEVGLVTGGMPIVTPWAFGIIVFELTALGAILATLASMIWEAGLLRREKSNDYDTSVADGRVIMVVECTDSDSRALAERLFAQSNSYDD